MRLMMRLTNWWNHQSKVDRRLLVGILSVAFLISAVSSWSIFEAQSRERERVFQAISSAVFERLELTIDSWIAQGESGRDLIQISDGISGQRYWLFSQHLIESYPVMKAVDYMPRVLDSDRAEYEREQSLELGIEYSIREFDENGNLVTVGQRAEYYPASDARLRGWDIATDPNIGQILDPTRGHHDPAGVIIPSPLDPDEFRLVTAYPIFADSELLGGDVSNPDSVVAFTLLVMGITALVDQATMDSQEFVDVQIESIVGGQPTIIYSHELNHADNPSLNRTIEIQDTEWNVATTMLVGVPGRWPDQFPAIVSISIFLASALVAFTTSTIISQRREALAQADEVR